MIVVITAEFAQSYMAQARNSGLCSPILSRKGVFIDIGL
jgi:hypothetical protein